MYKSYKVNMEDFELSIGEWEDERQVVIGIHGLSGNHLHMSAIGEALSKKYRFIAPDVRGRGNSSPAKKNTTIFEHAEDMIKLIEKLGLKSPILIGHSMGAYIASIMASKYENIGGLILVDGAGILTQEEIDTVKPALNRLSKSYLTEQEYINDAKEIYSMIGIGWNQYIEDSLLYGLKSENGKVKFNGDPELILKDLESIVNDFNHEEILTKIKCPTLLVIANGKIGGSPTYTLESYEIVQRHISNLKIFISEGNHYTVLLGKEPKLAKEIIQFIEEIKN